MPSDVAQVAALPDGPYTPAELDARENAIRRAAVAYARSLVGIVANPTAADDGWSRYLDLIAPAEVAAGDFARASEMAQMSGCALVASGYLRAVLRDVPAQLTAPYVTGMAVANVTACALAAGAVREPGYVPRPGDIVRVVAPEHVWIVSEVLQSGEPYEWHALGVEGGQRTAAGHETILERGRSLRMRGPRMLDIVSGGSTRAVVSVYDLGAMLRHCGVSDEMAPGD